MNTKKPKSQPRIKANLEDIRYESVGVKNIPTRSLKPNPHNPRVLFDPIPLRELKESIEKVGILIPLAVYWSAKQQSFIILDGQRRWMCAEELGLETVPANQLAEPNTVENIVTMFQIHNTREDWELMPTALKVEVLMKELKEKNEKKLAILTGLNQATVSRCKKLLSYDKKYQDFMLDPDPEKRIKADFFIELYSVLVDKTVKKMEWYSKNKFIDSMLLRYLKREGIKSVTDFRLMKQYISNAVKIGKEKEITKRLKAFFEDPKLSLEYLRIEEADFTATLKKTLSDLQKTADSIENLNTEEYYGEEELWDILERMFKVIRQKLQDAGRRIRA